MLNLIDRKDSNKSIPETGTSGTNAFGEMEGPFVQAQDMQAVDSAANDQKAAGKKASRHTYEGGDPSIQKMLDNMYLDNYHRSKFHNVPRVVVEVHYGIWTDGHTGIEKREQRKDHCTRCQRSTMAPRRQPGRYIQ